MIDVIIDIALTIVLAIVAFSWGYEKGYGDAIEENLDFFERLKKKLCKKDVDKQS